MRIVLEMRGGVSHSKPSKAIMQGHSKFVARLEVVLYFSIQSHRVIWLCIFYPAAMLSW